MGIFSNRSIAYSDVDVPVIEGYTFDNYGHYDIFMESLEDDQLILEAMCAYDMAEIETSRMVAEAVENGEDEEEAEEKKKSIMEASAKEFFGRIIAAIKKFFGKMKAWFKNIIDRVRAFGMDADKFVSTYGKRVESAKLPADGIKVNAYNYNEKEIFNADASEIAKAKAMHSDNDVASIISKAFDGKWANEDAIREEIEKVKDGNSVNAILGKELGLGADATEAEINTKLFEKFRGDGSKSGKKEITVKNVRVLIGNLKKVSGAVKNLNKTQSAAEEATKKIISAYEKAEKQAEKDNEKDELLSVKMSLSSALAQQYKNSESAVIKQISAQVTAINEYVGFAKNVCLKAIKGQ